MGILCPRDRKAGKRDSLLMVRRHVAHVALILIPGSA
jgi:hypothetical protein